MIKSRLYNSIKASGFTLVELAIVVVVLGVLTTITLVGYGGYQKSIRTAQVKSDLNGAAAAMENARNFGNVYPGSIPSTFVASTGVTITGGSVDGRSYCLDVASTVDTSIHYYITNTSQSAQPGTCTFTSITAIGAISGSLTVGSTLTAGALTPSTGAASYQWQNASTSGGTYTNIPGATSSTYVLAAGDNGKYLKVIANGIGIYSGSVTSAATTAAVASPYNENFESGTLASLGWNPSGTVANTTTDSNWLISGTRSAYLSGAYTSSTITWLTTYPQNTGEAYGNYPNTDGIMYKDYSITTQTNISLKVKAMVGGPQYSYARVAIYDGATLVKQWDTGNWYGGLTANLNTCTVSSMTTNNLSYNIAAYSGHTLRLVARAHDGGWCTNMSVDDVVIN